MTELAKSIVQSEDDMFVIKMAAESSVRNYKSLEMLKNIIQNAIDSLTGTDSWSCDMRKAVDDESEFYLKVAKLVKLDKLYSKDTMLELIIEARKDFVEKKEV